MKCPVHGRLPLDETVCATCEHDRYTTDADTLARRAAQRANAARGQGARVETVGSR